MQSPGQIAHTVPALSFDFVALLFEGQAVDFNNVVQHASKIFTASLKLSQSKLASLEKGF